jgi:hypothetical protein
MGTAAAVTTATDCEGVIELGRIRQRHWQVRSGLDAYDGIGYRSIDLDRLINRSTPFSFSHLKPYSHHHPHNHRLPLIVRAAVAEAASAVLIPPTEKAERPTDAAQTGLHIQIRPVRADRAACFPHLKVQHSCAQINPLDCIEPQSFRSLIQPRRSDRIRGS